MFTTTSVAEIIGVDGLESACSNSVLVLRRFSAENEQVSRCLNRRFGTAAASYSQDRHLALSAHVPVVPLRVKCFQIVDRVGIFGETE